MSRRKARYRDGSGVLYAGLATLISFLLSTPASAVAPQTTIGFDAVGYLYSPHPKRDNMFQTLTVEGGQELKQKNITLRAEEKLMFMVTPIWNAYIELPQAYGAWKPTEQMQLTVGRKKHAWNTIDEQWKLGILEPRFRWDYFRPQTVGLIGMFHSLEWEGIELTAFASPIAIRERGVPVTVSNGEFHAPTAWFIPPSSEINLFDTSTPVRYTLDIPPLKELVLNPGGAIQLRSGKEPRWASAGYAYKPMNQFLFQHDAFLQLGSTIEVPVSIRPRIAYHHVVTAEGGIGDQEKQAIVSLIHEIPVDQPQPANWTIQTATPAWLAGVSTFVRLSQEREGKSPRLDLGYLRRWGGNGPDIGKDTTPKSVFEPRHPFQSAIRLGVKSPLSVVLGKGNKVDATSRVIYDFHEDGALWSTDFSYQPKPGWSVRLGADLLATEVFRSGAPEGNFITRYQVNNRVHGGINYVF